MNYYIRALQIFSIAIANELGDKEMVEKISKEIDEKVLKDFILEKKSVVSTELFFYGAGRVVEMLTISASAIGLDVTQDLITFENLVFGREVAPENDKELS